MTEQKVGIKSIGGQPTLGDGGAMRMTREHAVKDARSKVSKYLKDASAAIKAAMAAENKSTGVPQADEKMKRILQTIQGLEKDFHPV